MAPKGKKAQAAQAQAANASEPEAVVPTPEVGLNCMKCGQTTTLRDSLPNGRNPMRRNCLECTSTDKFLSRSLKKPKDGKAESEEQKSRREAAELQKSHLAKMSPEERQKWYVTQKEERRLQERSCKRTFSTGVGFAQETEKRSFNENERDVFETSDMWCARMLALKKFDTLEQAEAGFKAECTRAGAKTMVRRGETLLAQFCGVEIAAGTEHALTTGVRQRADLVDQADLQDFKDEVASKTSKAAWRLECDRQAFLEGTLAQPTALLNVSADIAKAKAAEAELEAQWLANLEQSVEDKKAEKAAATDKAKAAVQSVGVEAMGLEAMISRSLVSMQDALARQKVVAQSCVEQAVELDSDQLKEEAEVHQKTVAELLPQVTESIEKLHKKWNKKKEDLVNAKDAQGIHDYLVTVSGDLKEWQLAHPDEPYGDYKCKVKDWKSFLGKCKAQMRKKDKAATKAQTGAVSTAKLASGSTWNGLDLCKGAVEGCKRQQEIFKDEGVCWSLDKDLLEVKPTCANRKPTFPFG